MPRYKFKPGEKAIVEVDLDKEKRKDRRRGIITPDEEIRYPKRRIRETKMSFYDTGYKKVGASYADLHYNQVSPGFTTVGPNVLFDPPVIADWDNLQAMVFAVAPLADLQDNFFKIQFDAVFNPDESIYGFKLIIDGTDHDLNATNPSFIDGELLFTTAMIGATDVQLNYSGNASHLFCERIKFKGTDALKVTDINDSLAPASTFTPSGDMKVFLFPSLLRLGGSSIQKVSNVNHYHLIEMGFCNYHRILLTDPIYPTLSLNPAWNQSTGTLDTWTKAYDSGQFYLNNYDHLTGLLRTGDGIPPTTSPFNPYTLPFPTNPPYLPPPSVPIEQGDPPTTEGAVIYSSGSHFLNTKPEGVLAAIIKQGSNFKYFWRKEGTLID